MIIDNLIFPYDYIISFIIFILVIYYFWKGFIQSLLSLFTWVGSILITIYSYDIFAQFITRQLLNIDLFQSYEYLTNIISYIISIPVIFITTLFILKRFRNFLSADLDKQILGIIFDKLFGIFYGLLFSYIIFSSVIFTLDKIKMNELNLWINENSNIIQYMNNFNNKYLYSNEDIDKLN